MRRRSRSTSLLVIACMCASMLALVAPASANTPAMTEMRLTDDMRKQNRAQVSGDIVVYRSMDGTCAGDNTGNWDIYMYDLRTHQESVVSTEAHLQNHPTIHGNVIAWMDKRDETATSDAGDIWMYDIATGVESAVCTAPGEQCKVAVGDGFVAWVDDRNAGTTSEDIYMKDLDTGVESVVTTADGGQYCVSAGDDTIVWRDSNGYPEKVWLYDVNTHERSLIATAVHGNWVEDTKVSEDGRYVVWNDTSDIYMYDRDTDLLSAVCTNTATQRGCSISGDRIVYEDTRMGNTNVYMYDISTGLESVVASAPKCQGAPDISGGTVVWHDERWGLFLDGDDPRPEIMALNLANVDTEFVPVEGTSRYMTAIQACRQAFPVGAETVVIATGERFPDALGGAALAGAYDAPILLTSAASLRREVELEILRLGAKNAIVLGDESALSDEVFDRLDAILPGSVTRIGGTTRYQTANMIAAETVAKLGDAYEGKAFVATGLNYPDALAASPIAYKAGMPVFLAGSNGPSAATLTAMETLGVEQSVYLGGSNVNPFPAGVTEGPDVVRLGGADRYATAALVADWGVDEAGMNWYNLHLATGQDFPDALSASSVAGSWGSVMLLTRKTSLPGATSGAIEDHVEDIDRVFYLGGPATIYPAVRGAVEDIFAY